MPAQRVLPLSCEVARAFKASEREVHMRIKYVGIELEGCWTEFPPGVYDTLGYRDNSERSRENGAFVADGSVTGFGRTRMDRPIGCRCGLSYYTADGAMLQRHTCTRTACECSNCHNQTHVSTGECIIGEIRSPAIRLEPLLVWMDSVYPQRVNETCGLHVHMSTYNKLDYMRLMDDGFWPYFRRYMELWGKASKVPPESEFWRRLRGENRYCAANFAPDEQISRGESLRYTQLNFAAYHKHGTMECRLLPGFQEIAHAKAAITAVVQCAETWLRRFPASESAAADTVAMRLVMMDPVSAPEIKQTTVYVEELA